MTCETITEPLSACCANVGLVLLQTRPRDFGSAQVGSGEWWWDDEKLNPSHGVKPVLQHDQTVDGELSACFGCAIQLVKDGNTINYRPKVPIEHMAVNQYNGSVICGTS